MATPDQERPHRSVSSLRQHERCPAQWKMQRLDGLTMGKGVRMIRGIGAHEAVAHNFRQKIGSGRDVPVDVVTDVAAEVVDAEFGGSVHLTREEETVGLRVLRDRTRDVAVSMTRAYHLERAPHVRPVAVERTYTVRPDPAVLDVDLVGRVDVVDDAGRIWDVKTTEARTPEPRGDLQLTMYALLYQAATGRMPTAVGFDVVRQKGTAPASTERVSTTPTHDDLTAMVARLRETERSIRAGAFPPTDPANWWCSEKWCGFWRVCPYVAGRRAAGE